MEHFINLKYVVSSILYSFIGIAILGITFWVIEIVTPENLWKEVILKDNKSLSIILAAFIIAIAIIIASAIHG